MKLPFKFGATVVACGLALSASSSFAIIPVNLDVQNGTYTFTATDGNTQLDGSTVTFLGDSLVSWNLLDNTAPVQGYPSSYIPFEPPLTTANSSAFDVTTYNNGTGPDAFSFSVASPIGSTATGGSVFWFEGQNNLNDFSALYDGFGGGTPPEVIVPDTFTDPQGVWTRNGVPDAASSFELLAGSVTALGACRSILRRKTRN